MNCCFFARAEALARDKKRGEPGAGELGQVMVKIRLRSKSVQVVRSP